MPYVDFMHTGVGSALLVSTVMGNAKASECGTGNRYSSYAFFLHNCHIRGNCAAKEINQMKHRYLKLFFAALLCIATTGARAYDFSLNEIYYNILSAENKTVEVTFRGYKYNSPSYTGSVSIPTSINYNGTTYSVVGIGSAAFYECSGLTNVVISNSVTTIGDEAFSGCTGLTSITIPNSVINIGNYAFYRCSNLKTLINFSNLTFYKGDSEYGYVASYAEKVVNAPNGFIDGDFGWIENEDGMTLAGYLGDATELTLPAKYNGKSVTTIRSAAFYGCSMLTSIEIPSSVTSIGGYAFYGCTGLTSITIPNSITSVGDGAFEQCTNLTNIEIPNSVTSIGSSAFRGCTGLTSIEIPNSVTSIGDYAFRSCTGLTSIEIPNSVTSIGTGVFRYCTGLSSITIPNSVTSIGRYAFEQCTNLTNIEIPNSVTSIGDYAFYGCSGLTNVVIGNSVTTIGDSAFYGCSGLTNVVISNSVTTIGDGAFSYCSELTSVVIGNSVTTIGDGAFSYCSELTSVVIGNSVINIGNNAFYRCSNLKTLINFSNLTFYKGDSEYGYVASYAEKVVNAPNGFIDGDFGWIENEDGMTLAGYLGDATELTLPAKYNGKSVTTIRSAAFHGCTGLTSITIPNSITSVGDGTFEGCISLKELYIKDGVDVLSLGDYSLSNSPDEGLFNDCPLEVLYLGRNLSYNTGGYYDYSPFSKKSTLTTVTIGCNVTTIDKYAFYKCTGLKNITIPNSVKIIISNAFDGCTALTNLYIEDGDSILTLHGQRSGGYNTEGTGLFHSAPLKNLYIGRELEFESERNYGYSPFYSKDIDTITISKKPKRNLRFGGGSKFITILYIDNYSYNPYSEVVPQYQLSENTTVRYFKTPYSESFFDNINCIKVPLGEITSDYHSISVTLNDSLIERVRIIVKDENTGTGDRVPSGGNVSRDGTVKINGHYIDRNTDDVYCLDGLKIGTDYPVTLRYVYNGIEYTTATTISTKNISPEPTIYCNQTLSTATIKLSVGDTIGLGAPIDEIGIIYNGENLPAERDEILSNLHRITISNLRPGNEYYYNIYFKIGTEYYRGSKSFEFSTKSPSIAIIKILNTQTTSSIKIIGSFSDEHLAPSRVGAYFYDNGYHEYSADEDNNILIEGLKPYTTYYITPFVEYEEFGRYTGETKEITTDSIGIGCAATATATTITLEGTYEVGDATLIEHGFVEGEANIGNRVIIGLDPDTEYSFTYYVTTEEGGTVQTLVTARTEQLTFNTLRAKATSNTRAVICAEANIANEEAGTGFEWRRIDAPDLVPSEIVSCAVHEGVMEGALHNLSANTYYKYRPYYTAASGKSYYGEWIGFGTADAYVYFTPTVHTYATASAGTNAARLSGYVLAGSDDIIEQGFEYWPVGKAEAAAMRGALHSSNVKRVTATGQRMSVVIEELDYGTVYKCRAYAITAKETVYGEEQSFETSFPTGIEENREESITIQTAGNSVYINGCNENETVFVYTLFGAVAYNGPEKEITLGSGTYIVKVGNITKKIQIR